MCSVQTLTIVRFMRVLRNEYLNLSLLDLSRMGAVHRKKVKNNNK